MSFELLKVLDSSLYKKYGENFNYSPSKIIPDIISDNFIDIPDKIIKYTLPSSGYNNIICSREFKVPEPCAYFSSPNTFIKSILYLENLDFYENIHLPKKQNEMVNKYLYNIALKNIEEKKHKKMIQKLMNNTIKDTDPIKNLYFKELVQLLEYQYSIEIIRCDIRNNFFDIIKKKSKKKRLLILQYPSGIFCPYGII